ncbi:MAG: flippase [Thermomicrobiales bacterium]
MLSDRILSAPGIVILSLVALIGIAVILLVLRRTKPSTRGDDGDALRRILRNSSLPIVSQLFVRGVDLLVALAVLRLLGPTGNGQYALAVIIWFYVKTISDFGLGLYATREISQDRSAAGAVTGGTALFRLLVLILVVVPVAGYLGIRWSTDTISSSVILTVVILLINVIPGSVSEAINSALNGVERMDIAAGLNVGVNLFRAPLAILLAATSLEIVGIAIAALAGTVVSLASFAVAYSRLGLAPLEFGLTLGQAKHYARESAPLLVNALLVSLFFRFDIFIVEAFRGSEAVGLYDAAFKPINLLTIIPAYATLAVFPLMSQRANDPANLARANRLTSYLLVTLSWAVVVATFALARPAIQILAGDAFLPESATLLRILVLFAPLSFLNGVFQYVLIAQGKQRDIVPAFAAAVLFNIVGNLLLVPWFGAAAAAALTVLTEIVIFAALMFISHGSPVIIHDRETLQRLVRPTIAGVGAVAAMAPFLNREVLAFGIGVAVFCVLSLLLGVVGEEERRIGRRLLDRAGTTAGS